MQARLRSEALWLTGVLVAAIALAGVPATGRAAETGSADTNGGSPERFLTKEYYTQDVWKRDRLTGDWGGLLPKLDEHGIRPRVIFSQFVQGVATGGQDTGTEYGGTVDWFLDVDLTKFVGLWPGLSINLHANTRFGDSIQPNAGLTVLPNAPMLLPLPDPFNGTDVTGLTITQGLWEGKLPVFDNNAVAAVSVGKFNIIDLLTNVLPNIGHGLDGFLNVNAMYPAWNWFRFAFPSQYGAGLFLINTDNNLAQAGFVTIGQDNVSTSWDISDSFSDGVGFIGFGRVFWDIAEEPGYVLVQAGGSSKKYGVVDAVDFDPISGIPRPEIKRGRPWVVTTFLSQDFWHGAGGKGRKAYALVSGSVSNDSSSFARWALSGSIEAVGPIAKRPEDRTGIAGWFTEFTDSLKRELHFAGERPRNTFGFELYYDFAINRWLYLTADLQLAQNLSKNDGFAVIPGGRLVMDF